MKQGRGSYDTGPARVYASQRGTVNSAGIREAKGHGMAGVCAC
jgi:hypothetical protein